MPRFAYAMPIVPGKLEAWRRFAQELMGSRGEEYEASRRRLGVVCELVWLVPDHDSGLIIWSYKAAAPEEVWSKLAASTEPFDRWLKRQYLDLHEVDLKQGPPQTCCALLLAWQAGAGD